MTETKETIEEIEVEAKTTKETLNEYFLPEFNITVKAKSPADAVGIAKKETK